MFVRDNLARVLDEVESNREPVLIERRGHLDVALISADELRSLEETAHLLRSGKNAKRLSRPWSQARRGKGISAT
jgi:antitoxin YefM